MRNPRSRGTSSPRRWASRSRRRDCAGARSGSTRWAPTSRRSRTPTSRPCELTQELLEIGLIEADDESALVRTLGRSFARLAEWQMGLLAKVVDRGHDGPRRAARGDGGGHPGGRVVAELRMAPAHAERRRPPAARQRAGPREGDEDDEGTTMGVGFADIVNYTRQSRALTRSEVGRLVDHFEERALAIISSHDGRIIKTIGDEVLFVADGAGGHRPDRARAGRGARARRGVPGDPGRSGLGTGPVTVRRRARPGRQRRLPADVDLASREGADGQGAGRGAEGPRGASSCAGCGVRR